MSVRTESSIRWKVNSARYSCNILRLGGPDNGQGDLLVRFLIVTVAILERFGETVDSFVEGG